MPIGRNRPFVLPVRLFAVPPAAAAAAAACAAAELIKTGVGAINRTGVPRPVLAPGPTTKAPV